MSMKRALYFLLLMSAGQRLDSSSSTAAALAKLLQNFEAATFPPTGWSVQYSGTLYWERAFVGGYGRSSGSAIFQFFEASGFEIQSLITSTFTSSVAGDSLSFDHAYATFIDEVDLLVIEVSSNGGSTYARLIALQGGPTVGVGMVTHEPSFASFTPTPDDWATKWYLLPPGTNTIRFTAKSAYGNNLYLDNIRVSQALANDVGVAGIESPRYFVNLPFPSTPRATISNFGTNNQTTPFPVTMTITGPSAFSYSSTKSDTLSSGSSHVVTFDPTFNPIVAGTYSVVCYTNLSTDQAQTNDTIRTTVTANNYNYGTNGGFDAQLYYFANSLSGNGAPAQPQFRWKDTTGSIDLIANGVPVAPIAGKVDDGYFTLTNLIPGKMFRLFGTNYPSTVYVNTNGFISFTPGDTTAFIPSSIPSGSTPNASIYALWADFDFSDGDVSVNRLSYKVDGDVLIVTFTRAPRYNPGTDANDFVSFQVSLKFSSDTSANSFVSVQYDSAQTGSSFLSSYANHTFPHLIGMENQTGTAAVTYRFVTDGAPVRPGPIFGSSVAVTFGPGYASTVALNLKAFLEGPYSPTLHSMHSNLINVLPLTQPYNVSPWNFAGAERASSFSANAVDWVFLELRTTTAGTSESARHAGLIKSDGSIVDADGTSPMLFDLVSPGNYYVVLSHRNHLPVMTGTAIALGSAPTSYDFTTGLSQAFGSAPMNQIESGVFGLVAGDVNRSGAVLTNDAGEVLGELGSVSYTFRDANLSGIVSTADANIIFQNLNRASEVPAAAPSLPFSAPPANSPARPNESRSKKPAKVFK